MDPFVKPSAYYSKRATEEVEPNISDNEDKQSSEEVAQTEDNATEDEAIGRQYYVVQSETDEAIGETTESDDTISATAMARELFPLPQVEVANTKRPPAAASLVDYSNSILMTSADCIAAMTMKAERKEVAIREREERKNSTQQRKAERQEEKHRKEAEKVLRCIQAEKRKSEREHEKQCQQVERV